jgi:hypothetical protein
MTIPKDCKRLAEVDFVLSAVNDACVEENNRMGIYIIMGRLHSRLKPIVESD